MLNRERTNAEYQDALRVCQRSAVRMRDLTEALLLLSRTEDGQIPSTRQPLDLASLANEVVSSLTVLAEEKALRFDLDLKPAAILGDSAQLAQVLTNLLNNAIKFSLHAGRIQVRTSIPHNLATIEIEDEGPGISPTDLPHVFERFYRGDQSRTGSGNYGLGLSIARAIVENHGGHISVSSNPGQGARFTASFPASHIC